MGHNSLSRKIYFHIFYLSVKLFLYLFTKFYPLLYNYFLGGLNMAVIEITDDNFETEVEKSDKLTLVDFWATWCGPCRKLSPLIDEVSQEFGDKVKFVKIKADENMQTAQKYSISGVPSLLLFKNGEPVERIVNMVPKNIIVNTLNKHL